MGFVGMDVTPPLGPLLDLGGGVPLVSSVGISVGIPSGAGLGSPSHPTLRLALAWWSTPVGVLWALPHSSGWVCMGRGSTVSSSPPLGLSLIFLFKNDYEII